MDNRNTKRNISKIKEAVVSDVSTDFSEKEDFFIKVDFEKLNSINNDVVGYIEIPNTIISYPILQAQDNNYYLDRDIYKKYNSCGSIFMDYSNDKFNSPNTVLYGHNMKSGLMFACINDIYNNKYGKDFVINIYTPEKNIQYKPFSVYISEPNKEPIVTNIINKKDFIETAIKKSHIDFNINPNAYDKILTLSTCNGSGEKRTIIHATKILEKSNN